MNIDKTYIFFPVFLFLTLVASAGKNYNPSDKGVIKGRVYDSKEKNPVEYANVIIYNPADSSMLTGGLTDSEGKFELKNIPNGNYYVTVQFIGYEPKVIGNITISNDNKFIDLGTIKLDLTAVELSAAEIKAEKMPVEYKLDRKVINVSKDLDAAGNTAVEILEKAPSVRVDINGDVYLRGSSNFKVLIDGKPSILDGSEALQQIPASSIERIEIITNPSVKYDPDGTAGILNIVLKKNKLEGLSGLVNFTAGIGRKYSSDLVLNYKTGKFNIFAGADWNDRRYPGNGEEKRKTFSNDTTFYKNSMSDNAWLRNGYRLRGGADYDLNDKTTFSLSGEYGNFGFGRDNFQKVTEYSIPGDQTRYYINDDQRRWKRHFYRVNFNF